MRGKITFAGLCADCRHSRTVRTARGSTFWRCGLADVDDRFARYPHLPVLECTGYVPETSKESETP